MSVRTDLDPCGREVAQGLRSGKRGAVATRPVGRPIVHAPQVTCDAEDRGHHSAGDQLRGRCIGDAREPVVEGEGDRTIRKRARPQRLGELSNRHDVPAVGEDAVEVLTEERRRDAER
jgi:hypothetical protein